MKQYDSVALTHYWGFNWLTKFRMNGLFLSAILFGMFFILCYSAEIFLVKNDGQIGTGISELKYVFSLLPAIFISVWISLARGAQNDFIEMRESGLVASVPLEKLIQNSPAKRRFELSLGTLLGLTLYMVGRAATTAMPFLQTISNTLGDLVNIFILPYIVLGALCFTIVGICIVRVTTFLWRQTRLFLELADTVKIDLLRAEDLAVFANQPLRTMIGTIVLMSSMLTVGDIDGELGTSYYTVGIPLQCVMLLSTIIVSPPIWFLRKRVRKAKRNELSKIRNAILGDPQALIGSRIEIHKDDFKLPDMLYYEDRIKAVWEWPFHAHVRRMAFYLIIPPAAWLMSALVEIMVDNILVSPPS
ncbi:MAG: hypothetical protein KUG75_04885 [Pseudomonadales bacterium]|nr:hypothetical protein [Pseudomonadales bacterium]